MSTKVPLFSYCREEFLSHKHRTLALVMVALVCCALAFFQIAFIAEEKTNNAQIVQIRSHTTDHTSTHDEVENKDGCHCQSSAREEMVHGDLLNRKDLLRMARAAKEQVIEHLRIDYGDYTDAIFLGPGKSFSPMSERSVERLKRKLTMKVLEMQINVMKAEKQTCDCEGSNQKSATYAKYVWATGGHSAAAGHGNLFNESYTAYLGRDARIVFGAIGIEFEDRNYAMGGTTSGLEVSMCWQQIFGVDVDFVSWDYGMTDGNYPQRMLHFGYRGGLSKGRPAMLAMRIGGRSAKSRESALQTLEDTGMSVFVGTDSSYSLRNGGVPDSAGLTRAEIEALPQYVQNLRCGDQFENGDPYCRQEKYTTDVCMSRPKQTGWHPGL